jgi:hypothetical protein
VTPFGAAPNRPRRLRPLSTETPLGEMSVEEWSLHGDDLLEAAYVEEMRLDRLDDHAGRPWPNASVVALPVRGEMARAA